MSAAISIIGYRSLGLIALIRWFVKLDPFWANDYLSACTTVDVEIEAERFRQSAMGQMAIERYDSHGKPYIQLCNPLADVAECYDDRI